MTLGCPTGVQMTLILGLTLDCPRVLYNTKDYSLAIWEF